MMSGRIIHLVIFYFGFFFQVQQVAAQDSLSVVTELFDRFQYLDQNDELTGYSVSVIHKVFDHTGDDYQINIFPWTVAFKKAKSQKNTMIFSIARTPEREDSFIWLGRLFSEPIYFWTLKKLNISTVTSLNELKNYRISVVKDANSHDYLVKHQFPNVYLMTSTFSNNDSYTRMKMLDGNRADIVIASESDVVNSIKHIGLGREALTKVFHDPELNNDLYLAINVDSDPELVTKYKEAFSFIESSGRLKKLQQIWELE